jgi:hypothetical protein
MEKGLTVEIKDKPGAAVIVYRRVMPADRVGAGKATLCATMPP